MDTVGSGADPRHCSGEVNPRISYSRYTHVVLYDLKRTPIVVV
jgi:hypothetical protein